MSHSKSVTRQSDAPRDRPRVVVIGGGGTGVATLYDLALRGFNATLFEQGELTSGTTGRHHGQLHCGARYAVNDPRIGAECYTESVTLAHIASPSIEYNHGLFVALREQDMEYLPYFLDGCDAAGIPHRQMTTDDAIDIEPGVSHAIKTAVLVPDGTIDAYRLVMQFAASAARAGGSIRRFHRVTGIDVQAGHVAGVEFVDLATGAEGSLACDCVINATGVWGGRVAGLAGCTLDVTPSPGTMVAFDGRHANMVISRLHPSGDGDIVVPQRLLSIAGSTQRISDTTDDSRVFADDVEMLRRSGGLLVPSLSDSPIKATWTASRPLAGAVNAGQKDETVSQMRSLSRDFLCVNHNRIDGVSGFYSVIGGKATVLRKMAEDVVNDICHNMNLEIPCTTGDVVLDDYHGLYQLETGGAE